MDFLVELIFSFLFELPLEALMESKAKCRIKTALVSLLTLPVAALLFWIALREGSVLMWILTLAVIGCFGFGIVRGHQRGWKNGNEG